MPDNYARYAATWGNDEWDGLDWSSPKRNLSAAVLALPCPPNNIPSTHQGTVYLSSGEFPVTETVWVNGNLRIIGSGTSPWGAGTRVKLTNGANCHLIDTHPDYTDYPHHVTLRDITLDGNRAGQVGEWDVVRMAKGGYNTTLEHVQILNGARYGLHLEKNALNLHLRDVTFSNCITAALMLDLNTSVLTQFSYDGGQIDECGTLAAIQIVDNGGTPDFDGFYTRHLSFRNIKHEAGTTDPLYTLHVTPNCPCAAPLLIEATAIWARSHPGTHADSIIYEAAGTGALPMWALTLVGCDNNFAHAFTSVSRGVRSGPFLVGAQVGMDFGAL